MERVYINEKLIAQIRHLIRFWFKLNILPCCSISSLCGTLYQTSWTEFNDNSTLILIDKNEITMQHHSCFLKIFTTFLIVF